ncbi:MAG TPA: DUF6167 family protein [Jiangellaceae bacterium]
MKRIFWIALGATAGILVARQITKTARNFTPDGAADRVATALGGLGQAFREFADDVKAGMAERDIELREALGIADNGGAAEFDPERLQRTFDNDYSRGT